ncbi:hypothetical protein N7490_005453 [Penicillium lividum]|nr:hypothetical protein N7490_005453 [Penicillium lividum]
MSPTPPSTTPSSGSAHSPDFKIIRKRNRVPLSCAPCRHRKLKCNRSNPCENCVKRGDAHSCSYAQVGTRKKNIQQQTTPTSPDDMQNRIDRLEGLVLSLMTNGAQSAGPTAAMATISGDSSAGSTGLSYDLDLDVDDDAPGGAEESDTEQVTKSFGVMKMDNNKSYYISDAHWASVLNDITEVKNFFSTHKKQFEEQAEKVKAARPATDVPGSTLLFGVMKPLSRPEIMSSLPSKYMTDLLVARYFNTYDPATHILHGPTFQAQYNRHWEDPSRTEIVWIAMLFAMMRLAMLSYFREGDEPPEFRGKAMDMAGSFRNSVAECLTLADYTKPHPYLIEALIFHLHGDFSQIREADVSVWVLTGVIARLAMRMGYHRDSKVFPNITPFQGEMRRRVWSFVRVADVLFSFQVGMPSMLRAADSDTDLPQNLYDDDFDEDCKELPQPRQLTEPTPISFLITKSRLTFEFGRVNEHASSVSNASYEKTMELDADIRHARDLIPDHLRLRPLDDCQLDPIQLIISRYSVIMLYHKAQIVLHRPYLVRSRENPRFTYSRRTCIDSAMEMVGAQSALYAEMRNGRLGSLQSQASSISSVDFLLAASIICLDLHQGFKLQAAGLPSGDTYTWGRERRDEMLAAIQRSKEIWDEVRDESMEAFKASSILGVMLGKLHSIPGLENNTANMFEPQDEKQNAAMTLGLLSSGMSPMNPGMSPFSDPATKMSDSPLGAGMGLGAGASAEMLGGPLSPFSSMFGQMPDMQANLDWEAWDTYIQNPNFGASNQFWPMTDPSGQTVQPVGMTRPPIPGPLGAQAPNGISTTQNDIGGRVPNMFSPPTSDSNGSSAQGFTPMSQPIFAIFVLIPALDRSFHNAIPPSSLVAATRSLCVIYFRLIMSITMRNLTPFSPSRLFSTLIPFRSYAPRSKRSNLSKLANRKTVPLIHEDEAYIKGDATVDHDIDYDDLYARSKAADLEVEEKKAKRSSRHKLLDEETKQDTPVKRKNYEINPPNETVYVGNLFFDLAAEDLRAHFEQFGTVLNTTIVHDNRGISKGFGYVQFDTIEEAKRAVEKQHLKILAGRPVVLQYARSAISHKTTEHEPTNTLFIGGIPYELTDRDIQDLFSDVHNTFDIRVPVDRRSGVPRGFAHVEFIDVQSAMWGKEVLSRKAPYGRKLKVEFTNRQKVGMLHSERLPDLWAKKEREKSPMVNSVEEAMDYSEDPRVAEKDPKAMPYFLSLVHANPNEFPAVIAAERYAFENPLQPIFRLYCPLINNNIDETISTTAEKAQKEQIAQLEERIESNPTSTWLQVTRSKKSPHPPDEPIIGGAEWIFIPENASTPTTLEAEIHSLAARHPEGGARIFAEHAFRTLRTAEHETRERYSGKQAYMTLGSCFTVPEHRRKGIAYMLMEWGLERADKGGYDVWIEAAPDAVPFYERCGFEKRVTVFLDFSCPRGLSDVEKEEWNCARESILPVTTVIMGRMCKGKGGLALGMASVN